MQNTKPNINTGTWAFDIMNLMILLPLIIILSFEMGWRHSNAKLLEPDSVYMLRLAEKFSNSNSNSSISNIPWYRDTLSYHPTGRDLRFEELLLPWIGGKLFRLSTFLGLPNDLQTLEAFLFYLTFVLNCLTALGAYFLMKTLVGRIPAFISSLFYAVSTANLIKTWPGCFDKEPLAGLFVMLMFAAFFHAAKTKFASIGNFLGALICGIFFAALKLTWGGYQFYAGVWSLTLMLYFSLLLIRESSEDPKPAALSFLIAYMLGTTLAFLFSPLASPWLEPQILIRTLILVCGISCVCMLIKSRINLKPRHLLGFGMITLFVLGLIYFYFPGPKASLVDITAQNIDEFLHGNWSLATKNFGAMAYLAPLCTLYILYEGVRRKNLNILLLGIWLFAGAFGFWWRKRLFFTLALPVPALILASFYFIGQRLWMASSIAYSWNQIRRIILALLCATITGGLFIQSFNISKTVAPQIQKALNWTKYWRDASLWLKDNTPKNSLIISWWDYGYYVQTLGQRTTLVDGGNRETARNVDVAGMLTHDENDFFEILKKYEPGQRPVYIMISMNDISHAESINQHAQNRLVLKQLFLNLTGSPEKDDPLISETLLKKGINTYVKMANKNQLLILYLNETDETGTHHPEWRDKLFVRLLPFTIKTASPLKHFTPVYDNGYVYIYRYIP